MIRSTTRITLRIAAAVATGLLVVVAFGLWRLSQGPVQLDFLVPYVEAALAPEGGGHAVRIDHIRLEWADRTRDFDLLAVGARLVDEDGTIVAAAPRLRVGVSVPALGRGTLAPSSIELVGVDLSLQRALDGEVRLAFADGGTGGTGGAGVAGFDPGRLFDPASAGRRLSWLRRVSVANARIRIDDLALGVSWQAEAASVSLRRVGDRIQADGRAEVVFDDERRVIRLAGSYDLSGGEATGEIGFAELEPARLARFLPNLADLAAIAVPLSGSVTVRFDRAGLLQGAAFGMTGASGVLLVPGAAAAAVPVEHVALRGGFDADTATTRIDMLEIGVPGVPPATLVGDLRHVAGGGLAFEGSVAGFRPDILAAHLPAIGHLPALAVALEGPVSLRLAADGAIEAASLSLTGGAGEFAWPERLPEPQKVARFAFAADIADRGSRFRIDRFSLDLGRTLLEATGNGEPAEGGTAARFDVTAKGVAVDDLQRLWPTGMAKGARNWVIGHLSQGEVSDARVTVRALLPADDPAAVRSPTVEGQMAFAGVTVRYWDPLPPFAGVRGTATFTEKRFDLDLQEGRHAGIRVLPSTVSFFDLDKADQDQERADIDVHLAGPLPDVLRVLDMPPLGYAAHLGVRPDQAGGGVQARLRLDFPLLASLPLERIDIRATGTASGVSLPELAYGHDLERGEIRLDIDKTRLIAEGTGLIAGVDARFKTTEHFERGAPFLRRSEVRGPVGDESRRLLGLDAAPFATGPIGVDLAFTEYVDKPGDLTASLDLTDATLAVAELGWRKQSGVPAKGEVALTVQGEHLRSIRRFGVTGGGLELAGRADFGFDDGTLRTIEVSRLVVGERTDVSGRVVIDAVGALAATVQGPAFDAAPLLDRIGAGDEEDGEGPTGQVRVEADRLWIGDGPPLEKALATLRLDRGELVGASGTATLGPGGSLALNVVTDADARSYELTASDMGEFLRSLGWFDTVAGGRLTVTGRKPLSPSDAPLSGRADSEDFRLVRAPTLARLLAAASLTGIGDLLSRDSGLAFSRLEAPFEMAGGKLTLAPGRAFGASVGITFYGGLDLDGEIADVRGTLVPVYTVNRVLGAIPILGYLLTGGEGSGLFAATYRLHGPIDDPRIDVNPLSALAPGFLRGLFNALLGDAGSTWDPATDPAADETWDATP